MKQVSFEANFENKTVNQTISVDDKFCGNINETVSEFIKKQHKSPCLRFKVTKVE